MSKPMTVQSYVFFDGRCDEAIAFYGHALGATVTFMMRNKESPDAHPPGMLPPGSENKVMHASVKIGDTEIMMSDGHCSGHPKFDGFSLAITVHDDATAKRRFDALLEGGQVQVPLAATFFATSFGMVKDKFGVVWMVMAPKA